MSAFAKFAWDDEECDAAVYAFEAGITACQIMLNVHQSPNNDRKYARRITLLNSLRTSVREAQNTARRDRSADESPGAFPE